MKKVLFSAALLMAAATVSFASNPKETKEAKAETKVEAAKSESTLETKDFYVDDSGNRLPDEYPTLGFCEPSETENCHATFTRQDSSSPWIQQGDIVKGIRPF